MSLLTDDQPNGSVPVCPRPGNEAAAGVDQAGTDTRMAPDTAARRNTDSAAHHDFRAARDHLLAARGDLDAAHAFPRPTGEHFNWALDWFDTEAAGNDATALRVVDLDADGTLLGESALSFAELSARSDRTMRLAARTGCGAR